MRRKALRFAIAVSAFALALVFAGFLIFASFTTRATSDRIAAADGIVVLTGSARRIEAGSRLLLRGRGRRLLISGVNRVTSRGDIRRLTGLEKQMFDCCVDVGYEARNTIGNADEAARWVAQRGYRSLIVVTAGYHMPRSLAEFAMRLPDVTLKPFPVRAGRATKDAWWLDGASARTLIAEYLKFLPAAGRYVVARLTGAGPKPNAVPDDVEVPSQPDRTPGTINSARS